MIYAITNTIVFFDKDYYKVEKLFNDITQPPKYQIVPNIKEWVDLEPIKKMYDGDERDVIDSVDTNMSLSVNGNWNFNMMTTTHNAVPTKIYRNLANKYEISYKRLSLNFSENIFVNTDEEGEFFTYRYAAKITKDGVMMVNHYNDFQRLVTDINLFKNQKYKEMLVNPETMDEVQRFLAEHNRFCEMNKIEDSIYAYKYTNE